MLSQVRRARARMAEVRRTISRAATPDDIHNSAPMIEEAMACLQSVSAWRSEPALLREFEKFRFEVKVAEKVIAGGWEFYRGWGHLLAAEAACYTPSGEVPEAREPGSVSLVG